MGDSFRIAVIIVNWNGKKYLKDCFDALMKQTYKDFKILFVDNGSEDGSVEYVRNHYKDVQLIELATNTGFAGGNNAGISVALSDESIDAVLCLNNDTIADSELLEKMAECAVRNSSAGMVAAVAYFEGGKLVQNCGLTLERPMKNTFEGGISLGFGCRPEEVGLDEERDIFAPGGVCALYKREMLEEVGMFDEDYFAYNEDIDLGFRGQLYGWKCVLCPSAKLIHLHSRTGGSASGFKVFLMERNAFFTAMKNFPFSYLLRFPFWSVGLKFKLLMSKNPSVEKFKEKNSKSAMVRLYVRVLWQVLLKSPKMLGKRRKSYGSRKVSGKEVKGWFDEYRRVVLEKGRK